MKVIPRGTEEGTSRLDLGGGCFMPPSKLHGWHYDPVLQRKRDSHNASSVRFSDDLEQNGFRPNKFQSLSIRKRQVKRRCMFQSCQSRYTKDRSRAYRESQNDGMNHPSKTPRVNLEHQSTFHNVMPPMYAYIKALMVTSSI
ncbi:hypothetical protein PoB_006536900 [Plakobranchus ocellatus]|uniref:Domain of unknown function with conserved HDNR motif domain-containing protein n=1 Tax=Plakobranchus ocellatus TaxID=259542 RepID=A0AAV4D3Y9_9GAST|nr:hypothetical protein PoB_006536900 [Plakobranchus ocellatus]